MKLSKVHKRGITILCATIFLLGGMTYLFVGQRSPFSGLQNDLKIIEPPETLPYTDLNGNVISLEDFKGKPLIVNSWASWSPFSKDELMLLNELKRQYGDSLTILAINRMEDSTFAKSYLSTYGIAEDVVFIADQSDNFFKATEGYAMPETIFYRADGTIAMHKRGVLTKEELTSYTENIMQ